MKYLLLMVLVVLVFLSLAYGIDAQEPVIVVNGPLEADEYFVTLTTERNVKPKLPSIRAKVSKTGQVDIKATSTDCQFFVYRDIGFAEEAWIELCQSGPNIGTAVVYRGQRYELIGHPDDQIDFHDFHIDKDGNVYTITYERSADPPFGFIIQKQDKDHQLLWEWHSDDHMSPSEAILPRQRARDYAHANSIDVLYPLVLMSLRSTNATIAINETTDQIEWQIGGHKNSFNINNRPVDGYTQMALQWPCRQHDARFLTKELVTIFDNGGECRMYERGVTYLLDYEDMRIKQVESVVPHRYFPAGQGSYGKRGNSHLMSWGSSPDRGLNFASEMTDGVVTDFYTNHPGYFNYQIHRRFWVRSHEFYIPVVEVE